MRLHQPQQSGAFEEHGSILGEPEPGRNGPIARNVDVRASEGLAACGGSDAVLDGWLDGRRGRLCDHAYPHHPVFNRLDEGDFDASPCRSGFTGRARSVDNIAYSWRLPLEHELVHAELDMREAASSTEGIAELFGTGKEVSSLPAKGALAIWALGWTVRTVQWRGNRWRIGPMSALSPVLEPEMLEALEPAVSRHNAS